MRVAIYARVSTESQEARGTIGSQLEVLRKRVATEGHELVAEYRDDGWSGARLDRPGLDALRDGAEAGRLDAVWCLSPDRLARIAMPIKSLCCSTSWRTMASRCCSTVPHLLPMIRKPE